MTADFAEAGWGEDPPVGQISGSGRIGWIAAASMLAPFAVIELGDMVAFEDGSTTEPEIESYGQTADGELVDPEEIFREVHGAQAYKILVSLRAKIAGIFEGFGITVLAAGEWRKPLPWLRGTEETLIGVNGNHNPQKIGCVGVSGRRPLRRQPAKSKAFQPQLHLWEGSLLLQTIIPSLLHRFFQLVLVPAR